MKQIDDSAAKLIIWRNDTLGDFTTYTLFELDNTYFMRRVIWKQRFEFVLTDPIMFCADAILERNILLQIYTLTCHIPSVDYQAADAVIDGIESGVLFGFTKQIWWDNGDQFVSQNFKRLTSTKAHYISVIGKLMILHRFIQGKQ